MFAPLLKPPCAGSRSRPASPWRSQVFSCCRWSSAVPSTWLLSTTSPEVQFLLTLTEVTMWMFFLGVACDVSHTNITWSLLMYFSYFLLFARCPASKTKIQSLIHRIDIQFANMQISNNKDAIMQIYNLQIWRYANIQYANMQIKICKYANIQFVNMQIFNMQICPSRWTSYPQVFPAGLLHRRQQ